MTGKTSRAGAAGVTASSDGSAVSVDSLSLRVPGRSSAFGRRVAESAMERVVRNLPPGVRGDIGALKLSVRADDLSENGIARAIAEAMTKAIARRRP